GSALKETIEELKPEVGRRKKAEKALHVSEERFRSLVETTSDWIWEMDQDGVYTYASPKIEEMLGYAPEEIIGKTPVDLAPPGEAERMGAERRKIFKSREPFNGLQNLYLTRDRRPVILETSGVPFFDANGGLEGYRGIDRDISYRKRTEDLIRVQRDLSTALSATLGLEEGTRLCLEKALQLAEMDAGAFYLFNKVTGSLDLAYHIGLPSDFVKAASRFEANSDIARFVKIGKPIYTAYQRAGVPLDEVNREKSPYTIAVLPIRCKGEILGCVNLASRTLEKAPEFTRDPIEIIAEQIGGAIARIQVEEELHHFKKLLDNVVDSMPSALVGLDVNGRVTQWNTEAEKTTGVAADDARGRKLAEVFPRLKNEMEKIEGAIKTGKTLKERGVVHHRGGERRFSDVTVYPLIANGVEGAVIVVDDVTDRVRVDEMISRAEKMLSVGGLAAGMAHEINNPLAGVMQNVTVMINRLTGDLAANHAAAEECGVTMEAIRGFMRKRNIFKMLDRIGESANRAAGIVQNMFCFAQKPEPGESIHDLVDLLDKTAKRAENDPDLKKKKCDFRRIEMIREYDADPLPSPCDPDKIQQVFLSVLKNGAEAMLNRPAPGGEEDATAPRFVLRAHRDDATARIEIRDNGPGIDEKSLKRVFEPFFTTKPVGKGTGLGLYVSYFIVTEIHGGSMKVESTPGHGAAFIIQLPLEGPGADQDADQGTNKKPAHES
ncbi:MAG: PAS domain S-box protein, partial [Desulfobacterales bacterium]|nr:PAS domain S-box protein [Desulfobacterales bacterium]